MTELILEDCIHCGKQQIVNQHGQDKCECGYYPFTKKSQQSHGNQTLYCNMCQMYVKPASDDGSCPYHQKVMHSEEGDYYRYDEFNQDGE